MTVALYMHEQRENRAKVGCCGSALSTWYAPMKPALMFISGAVRIRHDNAGHRSIDAEARTGRLTEEGAC